MSQSGKQEIKLFSPLARSIYEDQEGIERKRVLALLLGYQKTIVASPDIHTERGRAADEAIHLAVKIIQEVFLPCGNQPQN